ncbi:MAG: flagellar motor protein [Nevskiaceae bacterium]|nr:MAG: flagellar motor protein [Nevskiaceae bacterium]TBR72179.1 MAG: flagellar motor protein [Nevskiaceae bacterium]
MEITTPIGLVLALVAILGGTVVHGSHLSSLWEPSAFIIVVIGTFAATFVQTPLKTFLASLKLAPLAFKPPADNAEATLKDIVEWSNVARKQGLLSLEATAEAQADPFRKKALQLLVDGTEAQVLRDVMETEIDQTEEHDIKSAKVFEAMGIYSPTLGICGAVLGLISVMSHLADPSKLGAGIAAAFVATIYGIGTAYLLYIPLSAKLQTFVRRRSHVQTLFVEGIVAIANGENPRNIEARLLAYLK